MMIKYQSILLFALIQLNCLSLYAQPGEFNFRQLTLDYTNLADNSNDLDSGFSIKIIINNVENTFDYKLNNKNKQIYFPLIFSDSDLKNDSAKILYEIQILKKDVHKTMSLYFYGNPNVFFKVSAELIINGIQFIEGNYLIYALNKEQKREPTIPQKHVLEVRYDVSGVRGGRHYFSRIDITDLASMSVSSELIKSLEKGLEK